MSNAPHTEDQTASAHAGPDHQASLKPRQALMQPSRSVNGLIDIMAALRTPVTGCAWDLAQDFSSIAPYTIEEAYEVVDAIHRGDAEDLCDELGDLLLQVVFHARMAEEKGLFSFADVCKAITAKMIRRHPHVFGEARDLPPDQVKALWGQIKAQEKSDRAARPTANTRPEPDHGLLDGVPQALPALSRAEKLQKLVGSVGFDWDDVQLVFDKCDEELAEVREAVASGDQAAIKDEIGDLLFVVVNIARHMNIDPEDALRHGNLKFTRRFNYIESNLKAKNKEWSATSLPEMEELWIEAKSILASKITAKPLD